MTTNKPRYYGDNNFQAYVVFIGRKPGIYFDWDATKAQVHRFARSKFKGYATLDEAHQAYSDWMDEQLLLRKRTLSTVGKSRKNKSRSSVHDITEDLPWR